MESFILSFLVVVSFAIATIISCTTQPDENDELGWRQYLQVLAPYPIWFGGWAFYGLYSPDSPDTLAGVLMLTLLAAEFGLVCAAYVARELQYEAGRRKRLRDQEKR